MRQWAWALEHTVWSGARSERCRRRLAQVSLGYAQHVPDLLAWQYGNGYNNRPANRSLGIDYRFEFSTFDSIDKAIIIRTMYCIIFIQKLKFSGFDLSFQFLIIEDGTKVVWWWVVVLCLKFKFYIFSGLISALRAFWSDRVGSWKLEVGNRKSEFSNSEPWPGLWTNGRAGAVASREPI